MTKFIFNDRHAFVIIPKVASSTMSAILQHHLGWGEGSDRTRLDDRQWIKETYPHLECSEGDIKFSALVRHPLDRWASGMAQHFAGTLNEASVTTAMRQHIDAMHYSSGLRPYVMKAEHDQHTHSQHDHFKGLPCRLFKMENIEALWDWLEIDLPEMESAHIHKSEGYQGEVRDHLRKSLDDIPEYGEYLLKFYADDLQAYLDAE